MSSELPRCGNVFASNYQKCNYFWSYSHVNVLCCGNIYYIFDHVWRLTFVVVNFSVMFTNFSHVHSVILIRASE